MFLLDMPDFLGGPLAPAFVPGADADFISSSACPENRPEQIQSSAASSSDPEGRTRGEESVTEMKNAGESAAG